MWLSQNVKNYTEILGVIMNNEVKWNNHIDLIVKKASKKLYRGGHWGVPNTAIPYEKMANTEIPRRKSTKYRYRIF